MGARRSCAAAIVLLGLAACLGLTGNTALATPVVSIDTLPEWLDALGGGGGGGGYIEPVPADTFKLMIDEGAPVGEWPEPYQTAKFFTPSLYVMEHEDSQPRNEPGLVMYWGDPAKGAAGQLPPEVGDQVAAAWDFVFPLDPAFGVTNGISFSIHAPAPGMYVSLNLLDGAGNYREWIWLVGDPADPADAGRIPFCFWTDVIVNPVTLESNYDFETVFTHGPGFNLNNIVRIRFDENGVWSPEFWGSDPDTGAMLVWNAWDHVAVQPEPATVLLLGGGLLALARRRRRRK